ncbi:energy coupling factor transporter S component ThiW [Clostridiaceae bacterium M8S5]|nr:energy coupling factor transporter S component ThiW [Clostridiaceae bacterium M8S5]
MKNKKLMLSGLLATIGVILSPYSIPIGIAKCFPWQHLINVLSAVLLGPYYAIGQAFVVSVLRNILGLGTLLAFSGSLFGALLASLLYRRFPKIYIAIIGELIGTGIIGAIASYPIAKLLMGKEIAVYGLVIPFMVSSFGGTVIAFIVLEMFGLKRIINSSFNLYSNESNNNVN